MAYRYKCKNRNVFTGAYGIFELIKGEQKGKFYVGLVWFS